MHRLQITSILADADCKAAIENAPDAATRALYEKEAHRIADIQKGILAISANEKPYDIFICYKEADNVIIFYLFSPLYQSSSFSRAMQ